MWGKLKALLRSLFGLQEYNPVDDYDAGYLWAREALLKGNENQASISLMTLGSPDPFDKGARQAMQDMIHSGELPDPRQPINKGI